MYLVTNHNNNHNPGDTPLEQDFIWLNQT